MKVVEQLDPLVTEYIKINYAKAENFRNLLNGLDSGAFGACGVTGAAGAGAGASASTSSYRRRLPLLEVLRQRGNQAKGQGQPAQRQ